MTIQYPIVNGNRHDYTSAEIKIKGKIIQGIKSINYSRTRSRTVVMGTSVDPLGKTKGTNEYKADFELYLAEFNELVLEAGAGYGDVYFDISVTWSANGFDTVTDEIIGCTFDTTDSSNAQGGDTIVRKIEINPIKIRFAGVDDLDTPLRNLA
jgi:hypothetical protein